MLCFWHFLQHHPNAIPYKHPCFIGSFKNQLHTMSSRKDLSIMDETLACIFQTIAFILIQPADKDKNYISSLYNGRFLAAKERMEPS
jgi:tRNA nucleotidyltransferase (CCA-adding enzyme)